MSAAQAVIKLPGVYLVGSCPGPLPPRSHGSWLWLSSSHPSALVTQGPSHRIRIWHVGATGMLGIHSRHSTRQAPDSMLVRVCSDAGLVPQGLRMQLYWCFGSSTLASPSALPVASHLVVG